MNSEQEKALPPPARGRSASETAQSRSQASRVGVSLASRFQRSAEKTTRARNLRRASTDVEALLWQKIRSNQLGASFRRQHPAGRYILDFYCSALKFVIELDGGQHADPAAIDHDNKRTVWLSENGVTILRFWNSDVTENLPGVLEIIAAKVMDLKAAGKTPTRRWRADLPLSGGGSEKPKR